MDFHSLTRKELQALCKKNGIPANITNVAMADALFALHSSGKGNEEISDCSQSLTAQSSVESPERSEVTSPCVPRTRSVRNKVENQTPVNQTMSRTRRSTRNLIHGYADKKDTFAPINIDVQFSEVNKQSRIKQACVTQMPSMVSGTQKRTSKGESTARKTYGTRRSTRLAGKTMEDTNVETKEKSDAANVKLFSADCGDNFETNVEEICADISEDVQSTVSHLEEVMVTSKCEEMTSNYSSIDIVSHSLNNPRALYCDSSKDFNNKSAVKVKTGVTDEENGTQENIWIEKNKGDEIHEQTEVENKAEVIGENGYDINELGEVKVSHEVNGDNGEDSSKKPEVVTKDEVCGVDINVIIDNETEKNDLALGENGDMIVEVEDHAVIDVLGVKEFSTKSPGEQLDKDKSDKPIQENSEQEEEDLVEVAEEQPDNCDCDESNKENSKEDKFFPQLSEKEGEDFVKVAAGEQLVDGDCDEPSQETAKEDEFLPKPAEEADKEEEEEEADEEDVVNVGAGEQLVNGACDKPSQEIAKEDEFLPKPVEDEKEEEVVVVDIVKVAAVEQLVDGDCDKPSQKIAKEDEFLPKPVEEEEEVVVDIVKVAAVEQLVDGDCEKPCQEIAKEDEFLPKPVEEEEVVVVDIVKVAAVEQLGDGDCDKPSQEIAKEDEFLPKPVEEEDEVVDIVKVDGGCYKPSHENPKEDASIYVDDDRIIIPATATADPTSAKKKIASTTTHIMDNSDAADSVLFGKENIDEYNLGLVKEEKKQQQNIEYNNLKDYSVRKLRKKVKEQIIKSQNDKDNSLKKFDEELETMTAARRPALQMLPENQL